MVLPLPEEHRWSERPCDNLFLTPKEYFRVTVALGMCSLTHSYLIISTFPYTTFMALNLVEGTNEENIGLYAGIISASFAVGRACTSCAWGAWADIYGRKAVLYLSLWFSCLFALLFGTATSFWHAVIFRFLLGLCNGILRTAKTTVYELAGGSHKLETRGINAVMEMWGWGFLLFPALSGALSDPLRQYPTNIALGKFKDLLGMYPFLLPNIIGAIMCIISAACVSIFVIEPISSSERRSYTNIPYDLFQWWVNALQRFLSSKKQESKEQCYLYEEAEFLPNYTSVKISSNDESFETVISRDIQDTTMTYSESCSFLAAAENSESIETDRPLISAKDETTQSSLLTLWSNKCIRRNLIIYWVSSFVSISLETIFPLFCMSHAVGLGLMENSIGSILSFSGFIFVICQSFIFPAIIRKCGLCTSIRIVTMLLIPVVILIPLSLTLNNGMVKGTINHRTFVFLGVIMAANRVLGNILFSGVLLALNRIVPAHHRRTLNNMSLLGGSCVKSIAPICAGIFVALMLPSSSIPLHMRVGAIFSTLGALQLTLAFLAMQYLRDMELEMHEYEH